MKDLSSLLGRFIASLGKDTVTKDAVRDAIQRTVGFSVSSEDISIKENLLTLSIASQAKKSEVKLKEQKILLEVRAMTGHNIDRILYK